MAKHHQIDLESVEIFDRSSAWRQRLIIPGLRSWRDCKRTRNKVLAAEPTSEHRSREENGERDFVFLSISRGFAARSGGSAAKTLFRVRFQYRQLSRLNHSLQPAGKRKLDWTLDWTLNSTLNWTLLNEVNN